MLTDKWKQVIEKVGKIPKKFVEVDWRTKNWNGWFELQRKYFRKLPMKTWAKKQEILVRKKDKGMPKKEDRPTECILKTLLTLNTQRNNKQTSHQIICTGMYTHNIAKPYDKFYFNEKYYFPMFSWALEYKIKLLCIYFESSKF
jgi:hypothetical protein